MRDSYDFDAISQKDIYEEARDRLALAVEAESDNRNRAKEDLEFVEGKQWDFGCTGREPECESGSG
jgi:hypothetical protein